ncbi:hypothetical protein [Streptomyces sp. ECR3.8]|uniref:hypothetical protein n=1 Tax=Streptomyces sp. ECR3.8 TaxID=3461009 RepID=UPI0040429D71
MTESVAVRTEPIATVCPHCLHSVDVQATVVTVPDEESVGVVVTALNISTAKGSNGS